MNVQPDIVLTKKDYMKVQQPYASLAKVNLKDVEKFRQLVLDTNSKDSQRNYAIITIMAYAGLRVSEVLHLKMNDLNLTKKPNFSIVYLKRNWAYFINEYT